MQSAPRNNSNHLQCILAHWADFWARHLLSLVNVDDDLDQPFAALVAFGVEEAVTRLMRASRWPLLRWQPPAAMGGGGAAASYNCKPHVRFLWWLGKWRLLPTALEYATINGDIEVVGLSCCILCVTD